MEGEQEEQKIVDEGEEEKNAEEDLFTVRE